MKVTIDTKEDSHDEIRKAIRMLQHIIGEDAQLAASASSEPPASLFESQDVMSNSPKEQEMMQDSTMIAASREAQQAQDVTAEAPSTDDLFAELFSHEEIQKMDSKQEDEEPRQSKSPYKIEIY